MCALASERMRVQLGGPLAIHLLLCSRLLWLRPTATGIKQSASHWIVVLLPLPFNYCGSYRCAQSTVELQLATAAWLATLARFLLNSTTLKFYSMLGWQMFQYILAYEYFHIFTSTWYDSVAPFETVHTKTCNDKLFKLVMLQKIWWSKVLLRSVRPVTSAVVVFAHNPPLK